VVGDVCGDPVISQTTSVPASTQLLYTDTPLLDFAFTHDKSTDPVYSHCALTYSVEAVVLGEASIISDLVSL